ncbi:hypothetical protein CsatB_000916 [Cannabis sativa]|uniref:uncharacterized protein LOC115696461 n=1 Tax=Cannabis sativa TaxID=3483 RepID=UPI0011DFC9F7|nr:uncharacterized protein LOC115696461 [Cannabis sativa]
MQSPTCDRCGNNVESVSHALFFCKSVQRVCKGTIFYDYVFSSPPSITFHDIAHTIYVNLTKEEVESFLCVAWLIWNNRNRALRRQSQDQTHAIVDLANCFLVEYKSVVSTRNPQACASSTPSATSWTPPDPGRLKLNVDTVVPNDPSNVGFGGVIRNSDGLVVAAVASSYAKGGDISTLEAKSLLLSLRWCVEESFPIHCVETDCKAISDALSHSREDLSSFDDIINQIRATLSLIPGAYVTHVNQTANTFAHKLATWAKGLDEVEIWIGDDPCDLRNFLSA